MTARINPADVEERFVRGSGPGGQKINKTSSTVWLRHRPTGIEVRCQAERAQAANRESAWRQLADKVERRAQAERLSLQAEAEANRRRNRPKSYRQKQRMVQGKRLQAQKKAGRHRVTDT